jgi:hypothetical protein
MKPTVLTFATTALLAASMSTQANELTSVFSAQVEENEIDAFSGAVDQAFFNVQGDDDNFTVYSFADFDSPGVTQAFTDITSLSLDLTQSNAFFSANGGLEFFLATDTRTVDLNDTARYIQNQPTGNIGADVVGTAFGTLYSLGTGTYTETATGDTDTFIFAPDAAAEAFLISQINNGELIRIIATPGDLAVQATYGGAAPFIDGVNAPVLNFEGDGQLVPEPSSLALLGLGGLLIARRRIARSMALLQRSSG